MTGKQEGPPAALLVWYHIDNTHVTRHAYSSQHKETTPCNHLAYLAQEKEEEVGADEPPDGLGGGLGPTPRPLLLGRLRGRAPARLGWNRKSSAVAVAVAGVLFAVLSSPACSSRPARTWGRG